MKRIPIAGLLCLLILAGCRSGDKEVTVEFQWIQTVCCTPKALLSLKEIQRLLLIFSISEAIFEQAISS